MEPERAARARFATTTAGTSGSRTRRSSRGSRSSRSRPRGRTSGSRRARRRSSRHGLRRGRPEAVPLQRGLSSPQEQAKYDKLIRFGDALPALREAMAVHFDQEEFDRERVSAIALRLIELGWFRVGSERYVRERDVRRDDAAAAPRRGARQAASALLSGEARDPGADRGRGSRSSPKRCASLLELKGAACLQVRVGGRALQPHEQAAERLREDLPRGRVQREGLPHLGRDAARGDRARRARAKRGISGVGTRAEAVGHRGRCGASRERARKYARRRRASRTSRLRSSSSISKGERSTISGRGICASSRHARSAYRRKNRRMLSLLRSWRIRRAREAA